MNLPYYTSAAVADWNSLPNNVTTCTNFATFMNCLKRTITTRI